MSHIFLESQMKASLPEVWSDPLAFHHTALVFGQTQSSSFGLLHFHDCMSSWLSKCIG